MNDNALLFSTHGDLCKADAKYVVEKHSDLINWQNKKNVLDIGSADGGVTAEVLLPKLPKYFKELVGIDISRKMVKFAKNRCMNYEKVRFSQFDIGSNLIPIEYEENFDQIFSFYCLNWVPENRQAEAFRNMYDMLEAGGELFLTIIATTPIFDFHENMARTEKWAPFLKNVDEYISVYYHTDKREEKLQNYLQKAGFYTRFCKIEERSYNFQSMSEFWKFTEAINPFIKNLPEDKLNSYRKDYMEEVRRHEMIIMEDSNEGEKVQVLYKILVACASKPM